MGEKVNSYRYINRPGFSNPGTYQVSNNKNDSTGESTFNIPFTGIYDHTSNGGKMLMIDIAVREKEVYKQTVEVNPGSTYIFSAWVRSMFPSDYASPILEIEINSIKINIAGNSTYTTTQSWQQIIGEWKSDTSTKAEIKILDLQREVIGNDLAIDDISFKQSCAITSISNEASAVSLSTYPNPFQNQLFYNWNNKSKPYTMQLIHANGKVVTSEIRDTKVGAIDTKNIPDGIYVLKLQNENNVVYKKIVKE